jgi:molecular chaperone GrpE
MSKRFKDDRGEYHGESQPIITLTPDTAVPSNLPDSRHPGRTSHHDPTPLSVEETVEVLGELDRLGAQVQELTGKIRKLTEDLESKDRELVQLQAATEASPSEENPPPPRGDAADGEAKDKEIAELKDKYLRAMAEHENARRRIRQQSEESTRRQKENLLRDLLPIVDNLERAVEAAKGKSDGKSIVEGVQLVLASLLDFLKANGVRPISSVGEQFDPNRHEAADHVPHSSHPPNTVVDEFHRGYVINDKVLRPARVVVSKGDGNGKRT